MDENKFSKVIQLTQRAIVVNKKLLAEEKHFIKEAYMLSDINSLKEKNEQLNNLVRKQRLYLEVSQSQLQTMSEEVKE